MAQIPKTCSIYLFIYFRKQLPDFLVTPLYVYLSWDVKTYSRNIFKLNPTISCNKGKKFCLDRLSTSGQKFSFQLQGKRSYKETLLWLVTLQVALEGGVLWGCLGCLSSPLSLWALSHKYLSHRHCWMIKSDVCNLKSVYLILKVSKIKKNDCNILAKTLTQALKCDLASIVCDSIPLNKYPGSALSAELCASWRWALLSGPYPESEKAECNRWRKLKIKQTALLPADSVL